ncbi:MAG: hypothetical protein AB4352_28465 [Hormoscilla sp.]
MTELIEVLKSVQFLVDDRGKRTAVQLSMDAWEALLDWIEDREDEAIVAAALTQLQADGGSPEKAGWLNWEAVKHEWDED